MDTDINIYAYKYIYMYVYRYLYVYRYAAVVAGFTPIVLFLGNTPAAGVLAGQDGAWQRVMNTFIGIGIYLIIDNFIYPNRSDDALRSGVKKRLELTKVIVTKYMYACIYRSYFL
jgi:hypothetical protein